MQYWIIRACYAAGGHTVMQDDQPLRFKDKQAATDRAEVLNSRLKSTGVSYIVVEEGI